MHPVSQVETCCVFHELGLQETCFLTWRHRLSNLYLFPNLSFLEEKGFQLFLNIILFFKTRCDYCVYKFIVVCTLNNIVNIIFSIFYSKNKKGFLVFKYIIYDFPCRFCLNCIFFSWNIQQKLLYKTLI
jgi:hypothetical protein